MVACAPLGERQPAEGSPGVCDRILRQDPQSSEACALLEMSGDSVKQAAAGARAEALTPGEASLAQHRLVTFRMLLGLDFGIGGAAAIGGAADRVGILKDLDSGPPDSFAQPLVASLREGLIGRETYLRARSTILNTWFTRALGHVWNRRISDAAGELEDIASFLAEPENSDLSGAIATVRRSEATLRDTAQRFAALERSENTQQSPSDRPPAIPTEFGGPSAIDGRTPREAGAP